jgi:hypothetical protein
MAVNIKGGNNSAGVANVSADYQLEVVTPTDESKAGFVALTSEVDSGSVIGTPTHMAVEVSDDYRLRVGNDQSLFNLTFEGTNWPYAHLSSVGTTQVASLSAGFLNMNTAPSAATTTAIYVRTTRNFPTFGTCPTYVDLWLKETNSTANNAITEWGFLYLTAPTTQLPLDGIFFRRISGGTLRAVLVLPTGEREEDIDTTNVPARDGIGVYEPEEVNHYLIAVHNDLARFWINDVLVASIPVPAGNAFPSQSSNLPIAARVLNTGAVTPAGRTLSIGWMSATLGDNTTQKPWSHVLAGSAGGSYVLQNGNGITQTANWNNSAAPASATLSNTAAGYTTLGGQYQFAASATNETDWCLFGFTVPAGTASLAGKTLYITGVRIGEMIVTGAAAVNPTTFFWAIACGAQAATVTLATNEANAGTATQTTASPKRVALGAQSFLAAAPLGTYAPGFFVDCSHAPLVCPAGTYVQVIVKQLNGAATASLVWRGTVTILGYWE